MSVRPTWFESANPRASIVIAPAMGVRQDYYSTFAEYLSAEGFQVATIDYTDMGFNAPASLRDSIVTFDDWVADLDQLIEAAYAKSPNLPVIICGHSLGGQLLGTLKNRHRVSAALTIASGTGYWGHNPRMRLKLLYLWFVAMPFFTRLFGYFPGQRLNKVGNLPRNIALTWARWCRHPQYLLGDEEVRRKSGFDDVDVPILSISFADDDYIPKPAIDQLHSFYSHADVERRHFRPSECGEKRIGHFGFFKLRAGHALWQQCAQWLHGQAANQAKLSV
jgi:predicted alpha/beta hydrolase